MARAIRRFRSALGDTQQEFAARTGLSLTTIARYETGWHPKNEVLEKLAAIARGQELPIFVEIFERSLPPEPQLLLDELPPLQHLIKLGLDELQPTADDVKRAQGALFCLRLPSSKLLTIEQSLGVDEEELNQLVEAEAGEVVWRRSPELDEKYIEFLKSPGERTGVAYLALLEKVEQWTDIGLVARFRTILQRDGFAPARKYLEGWRIATDRLHYQAGSGARDHGADKP